MERVSSPSSVHDRCRYKNVTLSLFFPSAGRRSPQIDDTIINVRRIIAASCLRGVPLQTNHLRPMPLLSAAQRSARQPVNTYTIIID